MASPEPRTVVFDDTEVLLDPNGVWIPDDDDGPIVTLRTDQMVERYERMRDEAQIRRIVELGIWRGGSAAMFAALFKPDVLVALELATDRAPVLDRYVADRGLGDVVHAHYGVDQADQSAVLDRVGAALGEDSIDLVVDDASHLYEATKASFRTLFPLVRPGGYYIIEDWAASIHLHDPDLPDFWRAALQSDSQTGSRPLSALIGELLIASASTPTIASVEVDATMTIVRRGPGALTPGFDLEALCLASADDVFGAAEK